MNRKSILTLVLALLVAAPAYAQLNGENLLGDMGVRSGSQPQPGLYVGNIYYRYKTDTIKGPDGSTVVLDPTGNGKQTINATVPMFIYVSNKKLLGGTFGIMAVMPVASGSLEAPGFGLSEKASTGLSDLYVMPLQLGWRTKRADAVAGVAFFAPTGRHSAGATDNIGKGMWSYEVSAGSTVYLDQNRSWSLATTGYWETHGKKDGEVSAGGVTVSDVTVGQLLTLEGGLGKSFLGGAASLGVAYYAQWKLTDDSLSVSAELPPLPNPARHRVFGVGPDVTIPIAIKSKIRSFVNVRYLWETGAEIKTQGQSLLITSTIPVGGIRIPKKG